MKNKWSVFVLSALLLGTPLHAFDATRDAGGGSGVTLLKLLIVSQLADRALAATASIEVTDAWIYHTTNAQTILGSLGVLSCLLGLYINWLYYKRSEHDRAQVLRDRINDFSWRKSRRKERQ